MKLYELVEMDFEDFKQEFELLPTEKKVKRDEYGSNLIQYAFSYYRTDIIKYLEATNLFNIKEDMNTEFGGIPLKNKVPLYIIKDAINMNAPLSYFTQDGLFEKYVECFEILKKYNVQPKKLSYKELYENYLIGMNSSNAWKDFHPAHVKFWARITSEPLMTFFKENDLFDNSTLMEILSYHSHVINSIKEDHIMRTNNSTSYEPEKDDIKINLLMKKIMQYPDFYFENINLESLVRLGLFLFKGTDLGMTKEEMININKKAAISYMQENNINEEELKCEMLLHRIKDRSGQVQFVDKNQLTKIKDEYELILTASFPFLLDKNIKITEGYKEKIKSFKNIHLYNLLIKDNKDINDKKTFITDIVKQLNDEITNYKSEILDLMHDVNEPELIRFKSISILSYLMDKEEEKFIKIYEEKYQVTLKKDAELFNDDNFKNKIAAKVDSKMLKSSINDCYGSHYGRAFSDLNALSWGKFGGYEEYESDNAEFKKRPLSEKNITYSLLKTIFQSKLTLEEIEASLREIKGCESFVLKDVLIETLSSHENWNFLYSYASSMDKIEFLKENKIEEQEQYNPLKVLKNIILCDDKEYVKYILNKSADFDEKTINSFIYNIGTSISNTSKNLERNILFFEDTINSVFDFIALDLSSQKKFKNIELFIQEAKKYNEYYAGKEVLIRNIEQGGAKVSEDIEALVKDFMSIDEKFIAMEKKILSLKMGVNNSPIVKRRM